MRRTSTGHAYMEHRCGIRVALSARALVTATNRDTALACVTDASVTGAFIETSLKPALLARVTLRLRVGQRASLALDGYVVRHEERGIAVEWLDPGSEDTVALLSLSGQERMMPFSRPVADTAPAVNSM